MNIDERFRERKLERERERVGRKYVKERRLTIEPTIRQMMAYNSIYSGSPRVTWNYQVLAILALGLLKL